MSDQKKFECTDCMIEFYANYDDEGYLPDCPECGIDYRVFEMKEE